MSRPRRRTAQPGDYTPRRRPARPGDRWEVLRTTAGTWAAGPKQNDSCAVYADRDCRRRWIVFPTWRRAYDFAFFKAGETR